MTKAEFLVELEGMLELNHGPLQGEESLHSIHWDSLALMNFLAMADEKLETPISPDKVGKCKTVNDLAALMGDKIAG